MAAAAPLPRGVRIAHAWLVTGPDTMPYDLVRRAGILLSYWRLVRDGLHTAGRGKWRAIDRNAWLELDDGERHIISLKVWYAPEKIQRILYADAPFLSLITKRNFYDAVGA